jgi:hypothetical protein
MRNEWKDHLNSFQTARRGICLCTEQEEFLHTNQPMIFTAGLAKFLGVILTAACSDLAASPWAKSDRESTPGQGVEPPSMRK